MFLEKAIEGVPVPLSPPRHAQAGARRDARAYALRLRALCLGGALMLHAVLFAGGYLFDWFGMRAAVEQEITAQVTILPDDNKDETQEAPPPRAPQLAATPPMAVPPPRFSVAVSDSTSAITETARASPAMPSYVQRLAAHLARYKRYPQEARSRHEEGEVLLRFRLDRAGRVLGFEILQSSGSAALDAEAAALLSRAAPLPPIPDSISQEILVVTLPIEFSLRG